MSRVSITTLNCGKLIPFHDNSLIDSIIESILPSNEPDLIVLGLQEFNRIWESLSDTIITAQINQVNQRVLKMLGTNYKLLASDHTGATVCYLWAKENITLHSLVRTNLSRGIFNSSLKGSVTFTIQISNTQRTDNEEGGESLEIYSFTCCHLTANEGTTNLNYRVDDVKAILQNCQDNIPLTLLRDSLFFFFGDLNFRVDPNKSEHKGDELLSLLDSNPIFQDFNEPELGFVPTYKYVLYDENNVYNTKRKPSWCDRILYRNTNQQNKIDVILYDSIPRTKCLLFTDHQPVRLDFINRTEPVTDGVILQRMDHILHEFNYWDVIIGYADWLRFRRVQYWGLPMLVLLFLIKQWVFH